MKTVYYAYRNGIAFQGDYMSCLKWILSQGYQMPDGKRVYRKWTYNGDTYYDVGEVYILN